MAVMDAELMFSDNQAVCQTDTETQTASTNTIDLGATRMFIGGGTPLYVNVRVGTAFAGAATGGMLVRLQEGANAGAACTGNVLHTTRNMLMADLAKGDIMMAHSLTAKETARHLRLLYHISSAATGNTAGKVDAWLSMAPPDTNVGT